MNRLTFLLVTAVLAAATLISNANAQTCVAETNAERSKNGVQTLTYNSQLASAAKYHNDYMVSSKCFSHKCGDEPDLVQRVKNAGYRYSGIAENIAAGSSDCKGTVNQWLNSDGHRKNMLNAAYTQIGCASAPCNCQYGTYWTCVYGKPA